MTQILSQLDLFIFFSEGHLYYRPGSAYHRVYTKPPTVQAWVCLPQGLYQGHLQYRPGSAYHRVYTKATYSAGLGLPTMHRVYTKATYSAGLCLPTMHRVYTMATYSTGLGLPGFLQTCGRFL